MTENEFKYYFPNMDLKFKDRIEEFLDNNSISAEEIKDEYEMTKQEFLALGDFVKIGEYSEEKIVNKRELKSFCDFLYDCQNISENEEQNEE